VVYRLARHRRLSAALGLLAALAFVAQQARAAVTEAWVQRYSNVRSNSNDGASGIVCDAAGDIIVTGTLTIKYSGINGSVLWTHRYNGSDNYGINAVALDASGNVFVTEYSENCANGQYTAKYATADGALLWERRLPTCGSSRIAVDSGGNLAVSGGSANSTNSDIYAAKYDAADGRLLWEQRYNGPANRDVSAVALDGNDNVIVTGNSWNGNGNSDYYTAKYAATNGALLWEQRYNGPTDHSDWARAVAVDGSGNVIVTGISAVETNGTFPDHYYTAKYAAANGALLWEKHGPDGYVSGIAVDAGGNVVVTGSSYTAKYAAADGTLLWEKRGGNALALDHSGNVIVTGSSYNGTNNDYYTAKYAATDGALVWEQHYNGTANSHDFAQALAVDVNGNAIVTGWSSGDETGSDIYTAKYAGPDGSQLWEQRYNGPAYNEDRAREVTIDHRGNVIVTGISSTSPFVEFPGAYTAKYAANGALLWETRYYGDYCLSIGAAVAVDAAGNAIVAGHFYNCNAGGDPNESYAAKYAAADGALLWKKHDDGKGTAALAVDGDGNVIVTGSGSNDYYTAKYATANGALLWERRYNGPANSRDEARAVAVDAGGNVVVAGYSNNRTNNDYYTAKYAAADGALLWEKRYNGPANTDDEAYGVALDGSGNVLVTGYSSNGTNNDYCTAKYAAGNGALLWEKRYNGSANSDDVAHAVAVDRSGNVVVTGTSYNETNADYYTAKYAAGNGALLWEKRYNGPAKGNDIAQGVSVDGNGNVVVTGYSGNGTNADYYTAKYASGDGALLWEKRYNGPAKGNDFVGGSRGLALGPNGMVAITGSSEGSLGYEYATVVYRENLPSVSIALVPSGLRLRFIGVPGRSYAIERSPAIVGPWTSIATPTAPLNGLIEYTDTNPPVSGAFYRTSAQ